MWKDRNPPWLVLLGEIFGEASFFSKSNDSVLGNTSELRYMQVLFMIAMKVTYGFIYLVSVSFMYMLC